jgi:hypothetical protein
MTQMQSALKQKSEEFYLSKQITDFERYNGKLTHLDEAVKRNNVLVSQKLYH